MMGGGSSSDSWGKNTSCAQGEHIHRQYCERKGYIKTSCQQDDPHRGRENRIPSVVVNSIGNERGDNRQVLKHEPKQQPDTTENNKVARSQSRSNLGGERGKKKIAGGSPEAIQGSGENWPLESHRVGLKNKKSKHLHLTRKKKLPGLLPRRPKYGCSVVSGQSDGEVTPFMASEEKHCPRGAGRMSSTVTCSKTERYNMKHMGR